MQLVLFKYQEDRDHLRNVRTAEINGEVWFLAKDVCDTLGLANAPREVKNLDDDEKLLYQLRIAGQLRTANFINESGLYSLIFRSSNPSAKKFRKWVTNEVIPSIRKKGGYGSMKELPDFVKRFVSNIHNVDSGYFSVITELYIRVFARFEQIGYVLPDMGKGGAYLSPDISVGIHFAKFLKRIDSPYWAQSKDYTHEFVDGRSVQAKQYVNAALPLFIEFVDNYWIPNCAEKYFKTRDPKALDYLPKLLPPKAS